MSNKLLIIAAPSGAGKTTIARHLLAHFPQLAFSVSAATRERRAHEVDGRDYYFISPETFKDRIANGEFLEWEQVYSGQYYGTLHAELERLWAEGKAIVFDVDVKGALNIKKAYPEHSLAVFIRPPSLDSLRERLMSRGTETPETLAKRLDRAEEELTYEPHFDRTIINDDLARAIKEAETMTEQFLKED